MYLWLFILENKPKEDKFPIYLKFMENQSIFSESIGISRVIFDQIIEKMDNNPKVFAKHQFNQDNFQSNQELLVMALFRLK